MNGYERNANETLARLKGREDIVVLAIESSCDETACSVTRGTRVLSSVVASQIDIHKRFGGVVPEIASRNHTMAIDGTVSAALEESALDKADVDCVAVTRGAGLLGALLVGVSYAKALAYAWDKPLIAVNHIKGHIAANYLDESDLRPPYICLVVSGGHTAVVKVEDFDKLQILGTTQDDACGEAFDKAARVLGLEYPGGPRLEKAAAGGKPTIELPTPLKNQKGYDFSFSGIKTAVVNYVNSTHMRGGEVCREDLARSFQDKVVSVLTDTAMRACTDTGIKTLSVAGGVSANGALRARLSEEAAKRGMRLYYPPLKYCTDNAAMIACEAFVLARGGTNATGLDLEADADLKIAD